VRKRKIKQKTVNPVSFSGIQPEDVVENQNPSGLPHTPVHSQLKNNTTM